MISASATTPPLAGRSWRAFSGVVFAWGVVMLVLSWSRLLSFLPHRAIVEIVWRASVGVGFKVRLDCVAVDCAFVSDLWSWMGGGVLLDGCRPVRDEDGSRVGKNSVRRSRSTGEMGRIVLGGGMYVAKWVLKLGN
jgi:hypothetical protein